MKKIIIAGILILFLVGVSFLFFDQARKSIDEAIAAYNREKLKSYKEISDDHEISDPDFMAEVFVDGLNQPTTMAFVGNDILVLEKATGNVRHIKNGILQEQEVLHFDVEARGEGGLLGITSIKNTVFIYATEKSSDEGVFQNSIYKYIWNGEKLLDPQLVNVLPGGPKHSGGAMVSDHNGNIYAIIGDLNKDGSDAENYGILQNIPNGEPDDRGVILRVGFDPTEVKPKLSPKQIDHYFAIGIRNGFGLAIDPLTGNLWDTENGRNDFDEVNLVPPNFNSGWKKIMGPATLNQISELPEFYNFTYSDPEFSWEKTVSPTGLVFVNSVPFKKYQGDLFVGDCNLGNLYKFKLNEERDGFVFNDSKLADLVVNADRFNVGGQKGLESMDEILFGNHFGCISDLEFGPDGFLYIVSVSSGNIFRILPTA